MNQSKNEISSPWYAYCGAVFLYQEKVWVCKKENPISVKFPQIAYQKDSSRDPKSELIQFLKKIIGLEFDRSVLKDEYAIHGERSIYYVVPIKDRLQCPAASGYLPIDIRTLKLLTFAKDILWVVNGVSVLLAKANSPKSPKVPIKSEVLQTVVPSDTRPPLYEELHEERPLLYYTQTQKNVVSYMTDVRA